MAIKYLDSKRIRGLLGSVTPAVLATTGWTLFNSDHIITGSDGIRLQSGSDGYSYYDFGASDGINTNDEWVCDFDILRAASNDHYDHPMISLRSVHGVHGNPANNGDCKILLMYWANGNTGNSNGSTITNAYHKTSGTVTGVATEQSYCQQTGATLYYRVYMSKSGDTAGKIRQSAWTSDAYRTAEGSTGRVIDNLSAATMTQNGDWEAADDMRYLIVENSNGNEAWYTLKSFKFWNVASTGVADNMLSHTPTKSLTFNDVAAIPAPDEKATLITAGDTGINGGDASEWTFADNSGSGSNASTTGFTIATGQGDLSGNSARINNSGRDYNSKFDLVTDGGLTAIDNDSSFVMEWDTYRGSTDGAGSGGVSVDHPTMYLDVDGTGADAAPTNSGRYISPISWENSQNISKIYVKNSSGTAYNSTISGSSTPQARSTTRYYRLTFGETGKTTQIRLLFYTTSAARASDTQSNGVYGGTGAVFDETGTEMTGSGAGMTAWEDANPFRYLVLPTYNSDQKDFAHKNIKFWNDTTSNIGTPYMNLTFDARAASSDLAENTIFEETDTRATWWLQNSKWQGNMWSGTHGYAIGGTGGSASKISVKQLNVTTIAEDKSTLAVDRNDGASAQNGTYIWSIGGNDGSIDDTIDQYTIGSSTQAADKGDLANPKSGIKQHAYSATHAYILGGYTSGHTDMIQDYQLGTSSSSDMIANLSQEVYDGASGSDGSTYAYLLGGGYGGADGDGNRIDQYQMGTATNSVDKSSLANLSGTNSGTYGTQGASTSQNATFIYYMGGNQHTSTEREEIEEYTMGSGVTATDKANLLYPHKVAGGCSSTTHGYTLGGAVRIGGSTPSDDLCQEYQHGTTTTAVDKGNLVRTVEKVMGGASGVP